MTLPPAYAQMYLLMSPYSVKCKTCKITTLIATQNAIESNMSLSSVTFPDNQVTTHSKWFYAPSYAIFFWFIATQSISKIVNDI